MAAERRSDVVLAFPYPGEDEARPPSAAAQKLEAEATEREADDEDAGLRDADVPPSARVGGCPAGWYCFYEHADDKGRRLQWGDQYDHNVDFSGYGMRDKISSWVNGGGRRIYVYNRRPIIGGEALLWVEYPHASSKYVGNSNNDKADWFRTN
jgi:peptidase inhibitor family I36